MGSRNNNIDINYINAMGTKVITQVTFSSVIALGLMSFIIPSELTLASTQEEVNSLYQVIGESKDDLENLREKREVGFSNQDSVDVEAMGMERYDKLTDEYGNEYESENTYNTTEPFFPGVTVKPERGPWESGPMKTISDSVFSLIILIYVSVIFVFMFFAFCWKEPEPPPPDPAHKNIPMITSMLDEMEKQMEENKRAEEERISIEKDNGSIGKECTEMTEFKNGIDKSKYDSSNSINQSKSLTVKSSKEMENNTAAISRKDAETIVVNVITEKSKSSTSVNFKEEQV